MAATIYFKPRALERSKNLKLVLATALALFAMFFGAGNIIFPLHLGASAGQHFVLTAIGFLLAGVGVPFLGLFASSLFQGDYWAFFGRLGRVPAFIIITALMVFIGPLAALPRTVMTTYSTLYTSLPHGLQHISTFSALFSLIIFVLAYQETRVMDLLGLLFSPIKILSFVTLIALGLRGDMLPAPSMLTGTESFFSAIREGYKTMDLIAAFFFCSVAFRSIQSHAKTLSRQEAGRLTLQASALGSTLLCAVYLGFMLVAYRYGTRLVGVPVQGMIPAIATHILGRLGSSFVCFSVSFACVATALALTESVSHYLHSIVFKGQVSQKMCTALIISLTFIMSQLPFGTLMEVIAPILSAIYPALIVLSIMNILYVWKGIETVKLPVALSALGGTIGVVLAAL